MPTVPAAQVSAAQTLHLFQLALSKSKTQATHAEEGRHLQLFSWYLLWEVRRDLWPLPNWRRVSSLYFTLYTLYTLQSDNYRPPSETENILILSTALGGLCTALHCSTLPLCFSVWRKLTFKRLRYVPFLGLSFSGDFYHVIWDVKFSTSNLFLYLIPSWVVAGNGLSNRNNWSLAGIIIISFVFMTLIKMSRLVRNL